MFVKVDTVSLLQLASTFHFNSAILSAFFQSTKLLLNLIKVKVLELKRKCIHGTKTEPNFQIYTPGT